MYPRCIVRLEVRLELPAALHRLVDRLFRDDEVALENASNLVVVDLVDDGDVRLFLALVERAAGDYLTFRRRDGD